jgi:hypothetical protein
VCARHVLREDMAISIQPISGACQPMWRGRVTFACLRHVCRPIQSQAANLRVPETFFVEDMAPTVQAIPKPYLVFAGLCGA